MNTLTTRIGIAITALVYAACVAAAEPQRTAFRYAFIGDENSSAHNGVRQGLHEANLQGRFLNREYSLHEIRADAMDSINPAGFIAVIVASSADDLRRAGLRFPDHAILNVALHDDALRQTCAANLLHVLPSRRMLADAKAQWLQKSPGDNVTVSGWHPDFVKFAARDLNKRYRKRFSETMDQYAWAGWAAVKMTSDSVARKNITDPALLLEHLKTGLSFDGQKGLDLDFRDTGQLRQLLLLSDAAGKLVGEAPVRGVVAPDDVDSLGLPSCAH